MGIPRREAREYITNVVSASNKPSQHLVFEQPALPGSVPHASLIGFNFCPEVRLKHGRESFCNFALLFLKYFS